MKNIMLCFTLLLSLNTAHAITGLDIQGEGQYTSQMDSGTLDWIRITAVDMALDMLWGTSDIDDPIHIFMKNNPTMTKLQYQKIVLNYIENTPEKAHYSVYSLVRLSILEIINK